MNSMVEIVNAARELVRIARDVRWSLKRIARAAELYVQGGNCEPCPTCESIAPVEIVSRRCRVCGLDRSGKQGADLPHSPANQSATEQKPKPG